MSDSKFAAITAAPETSYGARKLAQATERQNDLLEQQITVLQSIAAEFQRFNDRKARRDVHTAYASAKRVEEYNRQKALNEWRRPSHMAPPCSTPEPDVPVGKTDPVTGRYVPATEAGQQQLEQMLSRMLNPPAEIGEWREKQQSPG